MTMDMQIAKETPEKSTASFFSQGSETRGSAADHSTVMLYFQRMNRQEIHTSAYQHPNQKSPKRSIFTKEETIPSIFTLLLTGNIGAIKFTN
jgi:hypothetical protein